MSRKHKSKKSFNFQNDNYDVDYFEKNSARVSSGTARDNDVEYFKTNGIKVKQLAKFKAKTDRQQEAYDVLINNTLSFMDGPAGTGKTTIVVAAAVQALADGSVSKVVISRPLVECGETMGYLPGTFQEKSDPYLRPIYDAFEMYIGKEQFTRLVEQDLIEIAPINFIRGTTKKDSFIIFDEIQNLTWSQLKTALTRIGENSKCVCTLDPTQIDLKNRNDSCAWDTDIFEGKEDIGYFMFNNSDVVRSKIVSTVLEIFDDFDKGVYDKK